jgi:hypothetical protein
MCARDVDGRGVGELEPLIVYCTVNAVDTLTNSTQNYSSVKYFSMFYGFSLI